MTTIKQLEKGCGKEFTDENGNEEITCGVETEYWNEDFSDETETTYFSIPLCPICEAKLQTKKEDLEIIEEVRLKYRKIGSIQEQKVCEEIKQKLEGKQEGGE